ncbi:MAG: sigma-70 family RNA polymerase sigma factor [Phycisphaerales bacterium]|nr:MAG: sigma-70 family RNA polymerase sigma factor [Phycisphaerales bacterium]
MGSSGTTRISFVDRLRGGHDQNTWMEFHRRYGELLLSYARRLGASPDKAEDVVQDVEMYLFKALDRFHHFGRKGSFRAYLRTAVMHAVGRRASQQARQEALLDPRAFDTLADKADSEDADWEREQYLHLVRWGLRMIAKEFEPKTLEAFRLHVLTERPAAETAKDLDISIDSVYQAKSRVLRRLRERIDSLDWEMFDM